MNNWIQVIVTAVGASGIVGVIITTFVKKQMEKQFAVQDRRENLRDDNQLLMMSRVENTAEMTHLMAKKLHDSGIINGDLKELDKKYENLKEEYNKNMRHLALEVLNR